MKNKRDIEYIDERIEAKLISKISHYRLQIRELMRNRHTAEYPELHYTSVKGSIRNLKVWLHMAKLIDFSKIVYNLGDDNFNKPDSTIMAEKLTAL
jgi:protein associated with RNAse G/E